jgi:hypothetical protein
VGLAVRYTLLQLTQAVLSSLDGEEINSISDTTESNQVVQVIKTVYDDIQSRANLPIQKTLFNLDASGDTAKPVLMTKPSTIDCIEWIKYNRILDGATDPAWVVMKFLPLDEFLHRSQSMVPSDTAVDTMSHTADGFTFSFNYRNDASPQYFTSFDDNTIIFDSYDSAVDTTLQTSKTQGYGSLTNTFTESDSWVPNLQPQQFSLLLNEAKSLAWAELKQQLHAKAEKTARQNWIHLQTSKRNVPKYEDHSGPNYGRK